MHNHLRRSSRHQQHFRTPSPHASFPNTIQASISRPSRYQRDSGDSNNAHDMATAASQKRAADDGFDPINANISFEPTPAYAASDETLPNSVVQSKEWATWHQHKHALAQLLSQPLSKYGNDDQTTANLLSMVETYTTSAKKGAVTFAVTGPMGTGKSATFNSLFSVPDIAREVCRSSVIRFYHFC